jgi:hypothetical protein
MKISRKLKRNRIHIVWRKAKERKPTMKLNNRRSGKDETELPDPEDLLYT